MNVYFDLQGGAGWEDVSHLTRDTVQITHRACSDDYKYAVNLADMTLLYDADLFTRLHATLGFVLVRILEDDDVTEVFVGRFTPVLESSYNGILDLQSIQISAEDYTSLLDVSMPEFTQEDMKIMDPADTSNSIVHNLFTHLGLSHSLIDSSVSITDIVGAVATEDDSSALDFLSTMLFEYGWVPNWSRAGLFSPIRWIQPSGLIPSITFNDDNIIGELEESSREIQFEASKVYWYGLGERAATRVYTENLNYDDDGDFEGYAVLHDTFYPDEANVIDDTTGDYQIVHQEYQDTGIRYGTSKYIEAGYAQSFALEHADFTRILITKNHTCYDRKSALLVRDRTNFYNRKAEIRYWNGTAGTEWIYYMHIDADVVYTKSRNTCLVEYVTGTKRVEDYDTSYVYDIATADKLAKALASASRLGRYFYRVRSEDAYEEGSFVSITTSNGVSATGLILERQYDDLTKIYTYSIRGYDTNYIGVAERTVRISSLSGNDATNIAVQTPKHFGNVVGDTLFRYYPGQSVPVSPTLTLSFLPSGSDWVPTSYQWYYLDGGVSHEITGETSNSLSVPYNASYLSTDVTTVYVLVDGRYIFSATITKQFDQSLLTYSMVSGVFGISYSRAGNQYAPLTCDRFYLKLFDNDVEIPSSGLSYDWSCGGALTISGVNNLPYADFTISGVAPNTPTFVACDVTYGARVVHARRDIPVTYFDSTLDWNIEWDSTREEMYSGDILIGNTVVSARVYSGTLENDPDHPGFKRLVTGVAFGSNLQIKTPTGTQTYSGIITVQNGVITSLMGSDGNAIWNGTITASGVNSSIGSINDHLSVGETGYTAISGVATEGSLRSYLDADEINVQEYRDLAWRDLGGVTTSGVDSGRSAIVSSYSGRGVNRRAVKLEKNAIEWLNAPDGSAETLVANISRIGSGENTILMGGTFAAPCIMGWSTESNVNASSNPSGYYHSLIQKNNGDLVCAYIRYSDGYVVMRTYTNGVWSAESVINNAISLYVCITQKNNGDLVCTYTPQATGYVRMRTYSGGSWSAESAINSAASYYTAITQKSNGDLVCAYRRVSDNYLVMRTYSGGAWSAELIIKNGAANYISLLQKTNGDLVCAYSRSSDEYAVMKTYSNNVWGDESIINNAVSYYLCVTQRSDGNLACTYVRGADGYVITRTLLNGSWSAESVVNAAFSNETTSCQKADGSMVCVYRVNSSGYLVMRSLRQYATIGGGIVESGSNANGYYTKFSDGTMRCRFRQPATTDAGGYTTNVWTYPVAFLAGDTPVVTATPDSGGATGASSHFFNGVPSNTSATCIVIDTTSGVNFNIHWTAEGRWF